VDRPEVVVGGLTGRSYIDKAILDEWYRLGREQTR
jgi:hypothetical protein